MRDSCTVFEIHDLLLLEHLEPTCKSEMGLSFSQLLDVFLGKLLEHACTGWRDTQYHRAKNEENGHSDVRNRG